MRATTTMTMMRLSAGLLLCAALGLAPGKALAQTAPKAAPAPIAAEPAATTASFGDWVLRCQRVGEAEKTVRACEVSQGIQVQGQAAPIAQIAVGRAGAEPGLRLTVVLPVSVSFPSGVGIGIDEKKDRDGGRLDLTWRRCIPAGCIADAAVMEPLLKRWRAADEPGRIVFKDAAGREITLPLSFRGLDPALDALAKEKV